MIHTRPLNFRAWGVHMQMQFFLAAMIAACGIGAFAAAALVWDRRRIWRLQTGATAGWVFGLVLLGGGLLAGSCLGLIRF
ncbi:hypothetical protein GCM10022255_097980 [Dactylosporangium darangshiense]|uniref:Uncharacterized protein n=3 Tax=Dactylosporangium darangshiense TaxID=579108 RepID=A0ABP8DR12_9ACTN